MKDIHQAITDILTKQKKEPAEVTSLNLDSSCKSSHVKGLDAFVNLKSLSLCSLGLTSLEGFPKLPKLVCLTLSDNRITGGLQHLVEAGLTSLRKLELANNRITDAQELAPLKALPALQHLDVDQCPLTRQPDYVTKVFNMLDELKYLDSHDREGRDYDGDEGEEEFEEDAGEEEYDDGAGEEEFEDEEGGEYEEGGEKEYAILVGADAVGEDEEGDYQDEGEGEDDDEDEGEDEAATPASGGLKRKREEEDEGEEEEQ